MVVLKSPVVPLFFALLLCGSGFSACQLEPVFPVVSGWLVGCACMHAVNLRFCCLVIPFGLHVLVDHVLVVSKIAPSAYLV